MCVCVCVSGWLCAQMGCALSRIRLAGCVIIYMQLYCGTGIDINTQMPEKL